MFPPPFPSRFLRRGYPAVDPISLHRYVDVLDYAKRDPQILTDFNVRYVLSRPHWRCVVVSALSGLWRVAALCG